MRNPRGSVVFALCAAAATVALAVPGQAAAATSAGSAASAVAHAPGRGHTAATRTNDHWSGYSANNGTYGSVAASWTEPSVDCSQGGEVVFWVGLDGDGNDNVEQTGSHVLCQNGRAVHTGWWETYPCYNIEDYSDTLQAGDKLEAEVTDNGNGGYELYLHDITRGWTEDPTKNACSGAGDVSAEVITETPLYSNGPSALAKFGTVTYTNVKVDGQSLSSTSPEPINMVRSGRTLDITSAITGSGTQFSNVWKSVS